MKAALLYKTGVKGVEAFRVEDVPTPKPGQSQILIKVAACGICGHDQANRLGLTRVDHMPWIDGHEAAGIVEDAGDLVTDFKKGDRVAIKQMKVCMKCEKCRTGRETHCDKRSFNHGGNAEYMVVDEDCAAKVPDNVDLVEASVLACAAGTCLRALRLAHAGVGDNVLVTGAGGGLGIYGLQLAKALGGRAIALTSSPHKLEQLKDFGADAVVLAKGEDYWKDILEVTGGKGADVVVDNVGALTFGPCFRGLAEFGRYMFTGQINRQKMEAYPAFIFGKECFIGGSTSTAKKEFLDCLKLAGEGKLKGAIGATGSLSDTGKLHDMMDNRQVFGRAVITA